MNAPPRSAAHLRAVHDVAAQLTAWLAARYPALVIDREAVLFGAATHDIGKAVHVEELSGPGSRHEPAGQQLLLDAGIDPYLPASPRRLPVGGRPPSSSKTCSSASPTRSGKPSASPTSNNSSSTGSPPLSGRSPGSLFLNLDDHLDKIAADADHRLAFPNGYPTATGSDVPSRVRQLRSDRFAA
ncbi:phosphohydrolase [Micromonospora sp. NPDC093277]|uniref:phosphohydrolase n=1 Tax=Micromonospora sp. NPDC093277 TaxID=3364291 RepID=UPI0038117F5B